MKPLPLHNFNAAPEWDEAAFQAAHQGPPVTSIRLNPRKPVAQHYEAQPVSWCSNGLYLPQRPVFTLDPLFHSGTYYVQEASSMFVQYAVEQLLQRDEQALKVLDLCAAPGGKSTLLASLLRDDDLLIANEVIQPRAAILAENLARWGYMNTWVSNNDPRDFTGLKNYFDLMLIDAPCTGSGLWRKDEQAMDEWSPANVQLCSERQRRIIADALPALKDGGLLLYATCSYSVEEDEAILDWIGDHFMTESLQIPVDESRGIVVTRSQKHKAYGYRFYPWKLQGEGFFLAAFRIRNNERPASKKKTKSRSRPGTKAWKEWLHTDFELINKNGNDLAVHPAHLQEYQYLSEYLKLKKTGTLLGKVLPKEPVPEHELALSIYLSETVPAVSVSKDEALQYLKKETVLEQEPLKGWHALRYEGYALGWGKWLGNRMNNYLPKNLRIRMEV